MVNKFLLNKRVIIDGGGDSVCVKVEVKLKKDFNANDVKR
jgi:hypothetical protein